MGAPVLGQDPGLQPERTALAWTRTSIAVAVNGVLVGGRDLVTEAAHWGPSTVALAGSAGVIAAVIFMIGRARGYRLAGHQLVPNKVRAPVAIMLTGALTTVFCLASLVIGLL
jgi:uncharacterized membrane protein YidH (DUF202 family)